MNFEPPNDPRPPESVIVPPHSTLVPISHPGGSRPSRDQSMKTFATTAIMEQTSFLRGSLSLGRSGGLRSGRNSAEPLNPRINQGRRYSTLNPTSTVSSSSRRSSSMASLNALDLETLDLKNLDPMLARRMLDEIHQGADIKSTLEKFNILGPRRVTDMGPKSTKVVTFDEKAHIHEDSGDEAL